MSAETRQPLIGQRIPRREDPKFLRGRGQYVDDMQRPGMLQMAFARSTVAHARIESIETAEAAAVDGVIAVFTARDLAGHVESPIARSSAPSYRATPWPILANDRVRFVGEAVAAVVAHTRYQAEDGAALVSWEDTELPSVVDAVEAAAEGAPQLHDEVDGNLFNHVALSDGDVEGSFARAACRVQLTFRSHRVAPLYMEPRAVLAEWSPDGALSVWCTHQAPHLYRSGLARFLALDESKIRVVAPDVGGGFGAKMVLYPEDLAAIAIAKLLARPVKWTSDRYEDLLVGVHGRDQVHDLEVAADSDGTILALRADIKSNNGAYPPWPVTAAMDSGQSAAYMPGPYRIENYDRRFSAVATNKAPLGPFRGIGRVLATISMERLVDEVARALDLDPLEVRRRNMVAEFPYQNVSGFTYECGTNIESIDKMQEILDLDALRAEQRSLRETGIYRGIGFAASIEHSAFGPQFGASRGLDVNLADESARIRVEPDGAITVLIGTHSHGQGHETTFSQVVGDALGVPMDRIRIRFGDTAMAPYGMGTFGSRSLVYGSGAIGRAAADIVEKAKAIASHQLEIAVHDLDFEDGAVRVRGNPERGLSLAEIAKIATHQHHLLPEGMDSGLESQRNYQAPDPGTFANSLHAAIVDIDIETGAIGIARYVVVEDCGPVVNPLIVDGQVHGAVAQGLGQALLEDFSYDADGQPESVTLADYLVPTTCDVPHLEVHHLESSAPQIPGGYKGMAEGGSMNAPAAIANAVADALAPLGVVVDRTPVTPDWIVSEVARARAREA